MDVMIRKEEERDYVAVETLTREAFWNLYVPGCDEHLIVHQFRTCPDFIPDLSFVAVKEGEIIGSIVFSRSHIMDQAGNSHEMITFGPLSVLPSFQKQGVGAALVEHAKKAALAEGYRAIFIYGYFGYYQRFGFKRAKEFGISRFDGRYPAALLALELSEKALEGVSGNFFESEFFSVDPGELEAFDRQFPPKEKAVTRTQEEFAVACNAFL